MSHLSFISPQLFHKIKETKILNWSDLSTDIIYNITKIAVKDSLTFEGLSYILSLQDKDENCIRVWGTKLMVDEILDKKKPKERVYIISLGQERYQKTKTINKYDLAFEVTKENIEIFDNETKEKISSNQ